MPAAAIAGKTYNTVILPDGKEWMAEYLQDTAPGGLWYQDNAGNAVLGRHYNYAEVSAMAYPGGWHVPTEAEWSAMRAACGGTTGLAYRLCNKSGWLSSSTIYANATDQYGLHLTPTGWKQSDGWFFSDSRALIWWGLDGATQVHHANIDSAASTVPSYDYNKPIGNAYYGAVRLVRDATPDLYVPHTGAWKRPTSIHVPHAGAWKQASQIFVPVNGEWKSL